ncbi:site-specific integrase [Nocardia arthritidis]|nr:tyrosine-type recombinase/integrase [Nocardia arthritidis]
MPRPRRKVGKWGHINRKQVETNYWYAECYIRDHDGERRRARKYSPEGVRDKYGAAAEQELLDHLENRVRSVGAELSLDSTVRKLWEKYLKKLEKDGKAPDTISRYTDVSKFILDGLGGLTLNEANSTPRLETFLDTVQTKHGIANAITTRTVLSGMFGLACRFVDGFGKVNPVRETSPIAGAKKEKPRQFEADEVTQLLIDVCESDLPCPELDKGGVPKVSRYKAPTVAEYCQSADLADPITMFAATGLRESELLGIKDTGIDLDRKVVLIDGKVTRIPGKGLVRVSYENDPKNRNRELALPGYAIPMLRERLARNKKNPNKHGVTFPSATGTLRDPDNLNRQVRRVRAALGLEWVTTTAFRRWVFTELDNAGLTPRKVADQGGHLKPSMSQDKYMKRFKAHPENASALDRAVRQSHQSRDRKADQSGE